MNTDQAGLSLLGTPSHAKIHRHAGEASAASSSWALFSRNAANPAS